MLASCTDYKHQTSSNGNLYMTNTNLVEPIVYKTDSGNKFEDDSTTLTGYKI